MESGGFVIWLTGLPSSGKSTLARGLERRLVGLGQRVQVLDGDDVREGISRELGYSREDRDENIRRIASVARILIRHGVVTIVSAISPYQEARAAARRTINRFVEVYVKCPASVCMTRDTKGLYKKAKEGKLQHFTGVSDPYEEPQGSEIVVETFRQTVEDEVEKVLLFLRDAKYLQDA